MSKHQECLHLDHQGLNVGVPLEESLMLYSLLKSKAEAPIFGSLTQPQGWKVIIDGLLDASIETRTHNLISRIFPSSNSRDLSPEPDYMRHQNRFT